MIPSIDEIRRSLNGAWLLARRDRSGMEWLDLSIEGFFRSFFAAVLVAPLYAWLVVERYQSQGVLTPDIGAVVIGESLSYVLGWIAFPVAAAPITHFLGLGGRYVPLVVASNWAAVLQVVLFVLVMLVSGLFPDGLQGPLMLVATLVALVYEWFVIRTALETTIGIAIGLVVIDILLSSIMSIGTTALIGYG